MAPATAGVAPAASYSRRRATYREAGQAGWQSEDNMSRLNLPRRFWISSILTLAWGSVPSGIYNLVAGSEKWGIVLLALGLILLAILVVPGVLGRLEKRAVLVPQGALFVVSLAIFSLLRLWMTTT